jgi:arylsulfatase A-like enzyme
MHVDTLRGDHLPRYGYARETMRAVNAFSGRWVKHLFTTTSWTVPSSLSALTGLGIEHHGVGWFTGSGPNAPLEAATLATLLHDRGYATLLACANEALTSIDGVSDGFDRVLDNNTEAQPAYYASQLAQFALDWVAGLPPEQPFFVWMQPMDVHGPYRPRGYLGTFSDPENAPFDTSSTSTENGQTEQFAAAVAAAEGNDEATAALVEQLNAIYDESILNVDDGLAHLLDGLGQFGQTDDTLVVFAGDHGETLADDVPVLYFGHGGHIRPELVQVPLAFFHPRLSDEDIDCLSSNVDLLPTLLRAVGLEAPEGIDGAAMQDGCREAVAASVFVNDDTEAEFAELGGRGGDGFIRRDCSTGVMLGYDLAVDPLANTPIAASDVPNFSTIEAEIDALEVRLVDEMGARPCAGGD